MALRLCTSTAYPRVGYLIALDSPTWLISKDKWITADSAIRVETYQSSWLGKLGKRDLLSNIHDF